MQCKEWDDANSELFKESYDEAVHKNSYKSRLYELISASLERNVCVVKEEKVRYIATRISSRSSSGVFMEFSARRRGEIHEGSVPFLPASMDCAPQDLERLFARPFRLSGHIV